MVVIVVVVIVVVGVELTRSLTFLLKSIVQRERSRGFVKKTQNMLTLYILSLTLV